MTDVTACGADPSGTRDSTAAFVMAAADSSPFHIPSGTYVISSPININFPGQLVTGDGRDRSIITVPPTFSGGAVFICNTGEPGQQFRDFTLTFQQPNATPIQYPPGISGTGRFRVRDCRISSAWIAIDMPGNCGGSTILDVEMSAYYRGIVIDGAEDSVRIRGLHFWPFDVPAALMSYMSANATAIASARCDDLHIDDCLLLFGWGVSLSQSPSGTTFGRMTGTDCDSCSGLAMGAGNFSVSNCFFTQDLPTRQAILHTGGDLIVSGSMFSSPVLNNPVIQTSSPNFLILSNNSFQLPPGATMSAPAVLAMTGSRLTMTGNRASDCAGGVGNFVSLAEDGWHVVMGNTFMGWGAQIPANPVSTVYANNSGVMQ